MNEEKIILLCKAMGISKEELIENLLEDYLKKFEEVFAVEPVYPNNTMGICEKGRGKNIILSNGVLVPQSSCVKYASAEYIGKGQFKLGNHFTKLTVPILLKIEEHWNDLATPKLTELEKYLTDIVGIPVKGRILYNMDIGAFDNLKKEYFKEINAPRIETENIKNIKRKW